MRRDSLAWVLKKAVPSSNVSNACISRNVITNEYYIWVEPHHAAFWSAFKRRYPDWRKRASELGSDGRGICPVFKTERQLLLWLCRTLSLSDSAANLLVLFSRRDYVSWE